MKNKSFLQNRWLLVFYDLIIFLISAFFVLFVSGNKLGELKVLYQTLLALGCIFLSRLLCGIYKQIWRYGGIQSYIRLLIADGIGFIAYFSLQYALPSGYQVSVSRAFAFISFDLLLALALRMIYRYIFKCVNRNTPFGKFIFKFINFFGQTKINLHDTDETQKIKIAILGAGRVGTALAEDLLNNPTSHYLPRIFIDISKEKIGRQIYGASVIAEDKATPDYLKDYKIQEIIFAIPELNKEKKNDLYNKYKNAGFKVKTYDFPVLQTTSGNGKRHLREFSIEDLLGRKSIDVVDENIISFYKNKVVLVTGGGGSIGSELCRQLATMQVKQIIILDIYENCAYDIQQELKMKYGNTLDLKVEIISITNKKALERVFIKYHPNIVIMAAAHKHVPLMENNVVEAVENNVFGTLNTIELSEKYNVDRVHMVSTDKAVNPTSVMGATKRICEMMVEAHSTKKQHTTFSATRFGNVLGSAGSVIPLFKKQIANGGPITLTDYRIIRYFMTIPEASKLVLCSASMAKNGELFVLDMGEPVKIYDLAVNMIELSGFVPNKDIEIIETGLRPGEKLYEELLVKTEELDKTDNSMIFIERDKPLPLTTIKEKLTKLEEGIKVGDDVNMKNIIKEVVPTFIEKEETNKNVK